MQANPAQTGDFDGWIRAGGLYRRQWSTVPVDYRTYSVWADYKFRPVGTTEVSVGTLAEHDEAGDGRLTWTQVGVSVALAQQLSAQHSLHGGFGWSFVQRSFGLGSLTFKNQWNGKYFNPSADPRENLSESSALSGSVSAGALWVFKPNTTRTRVMAGLSGFHLNQPKINFLDEKPKALPVRWTGQLGASIQIGENIDAVVHSLFQKMNVSSEWIVAGGLRRILDLSDETFSALQITVALRARDAIIPAFQLEYESWTIGVSYDWNLSGFKVATNNRGGPEFAVIYRPLPVPPVKVYKACPIF